MANDKTSFHLQHTARPEHIENILIAIAENETFDVDIIYSKLISVNYQIKRDSGVSRSFDLCKKLGLFDKVSKQTDYHLTGLGQACRKLALYRRDIFYDVL